MATIMKAVLCKAVPSLGQAGDVVEVSPGHFRNYLQPRGLASEATEKSLAMVQRSKAQEARTEARERRDATQIAEQLARLPVRLTLKTGENDRVFGSVTAADIAEKLRVAGYEFDKRKILLEEPIKRLGLYTVHIKLHPEVEAKVKVLVDRQ